MVADSGNCRVQVFDRDGGFVLSFGERGNGPGQFMSPDGIAVGAEVTTHPDKIAQEGQLQTTLANLANNPS